VLIEETTVLSRVGKETRNIRVSLLGMEVVKETSLGGHNRFHESKSFDSDKVSIPITNVSNLNYKL